MTDISTPYITALAAVEAFYVAAEQAYRDTPNATTRLMWHRAKAALNAMTLPYVLEPVECAGASDAG